MSVVLGAVLEMSLDEVVLLAGMRAQPRAACRAIALTKRSPADRHRVGGHRRRRLRVEGGVHGAQRALADYI